jgi:hypothetical protein
MMLEGTPWGPKTTLFAVRTPEYAPPDTLVEFEKALEIGLYIPTFEVCGQNRTFPVGKRTPPEKSGEAPETLVNCKFCGL